MRDWMLEARKKNRMTQKQAADALEIAESYYSLIENGTRMKSLDLTFATKLGNLYGMSVEEIIDAEGAARCESQ